MKTPRRSSTSSRSSRRLGACGHLASWGHARATRRSILRLLSPGGVTWVDRRVRPAKDRKDSPRRGGIRVRLDQGLDQLTFGQASDSP
jgi:hypothetical protein